MTFIAFISSFPDCFINSLRITLKESLRREIFPDILDLFLLFFITFYLISVIYIVGFIVIV